MHFTSDEIKIVSISAPVFLKMLRERERRILNTIYGNFRNGKKDLITELAEWCVVREQIEELVKALKLNEEE